MNTQTQQDTVAVIQKFSAATNKHDVKAMMSLMSNDCVFESTVPPPDGGRFEGSKKLKNFGKNFLNLPLKLSLKLKRSLLLTVAVLSVGYTIGLIKMVNQDMFAEWMYLLYKTEKLQRNFRM